MITSIFTDKLTMLKSQLSQIDQHIEQLQSADQRLEKLVIDLNELLVISAPMGATEAVTSAISEALGLTSLGVDISPTAIALDEEPAKNIEELDADAPYQVPIDLLLEIGNLEDKENYFSYYVFPSSDNCADDYISTDYCNLEDRSTWVNTWLVMWEKHLSPILARRNQIIEILDNCVRQLDKNYQAAFEIRQLFEGMGFEHLLEYNLIQPINATEASAKDLAAWELGIGANYRTIEDLIHRAIKHHRLDILKALGVGSDKPINFHDHLLAKYQRLVGQPDVNYWDWAVYPESKQVCQELTDLLSLPEPNGRANSLLQDLPNGINPFTYIDLPTFDKYGFTHDIVSRTGKFYYCVPDVKQEIREAFKVWHGIALKALGEDRLKAVYKVCFGCAWSVVQEILTMDFQPKQRHYSYQDIRDFAKQAISDWWTPLGVSRNADKATVKAAYKALVKEHHPDVNKSPSSEARIRAINEAWENYEKSFNYTHA